MKVHLGTAPDSWGVWFPDDPRQTPWQRCLDEIAAAGYTWTELGPYAYMPTDPAVLRREFEQRGLRLAAGITIGALHDPTAFGTVRDEMLRIGELTRALDGEYMVLIGDNHRDGFTGEFRSPASLPAESWAHYVEATNNLGRIAREQLGLRLVFHPHADTHVELTEHIEALLRDTDPAYVNLCFDLGHHEYKGGDAIDFLRKYHDRIPYLHLKSVDPDIRAHVLATNPPFAEAVAQFMFVEPNQGSVDFPAVAALLNEINFAGFGIVEQDMFPCDFSRPLPIAKRTREYLVGLGLG